MDKIAEQIRQQICQGTNLRPKNLAVLGSDGILALVQHKGRNCSEARSWVELIDLTSRKAEIVWIGVKLAGAKKSKLCHRYLQI